MIIEKNQIYEMEAIDFLKQIGDKIVDLILCDLPYGLTENKWDSIIPLEKLWGQYKRIIKDEGVIVLTASQPFTSRLVMSNVDMFKHEWIWIKNRGSNFANTIREPFKEHESILVFANNTWTYNPQMQERTGNGLDRVKYDLNWKTKSKNYRNFEDRLGQKRPELRVPSSWQKFNVNTGLHPTQKPLALFEYLIKTYSNEGDLVVDNCVGSGTTAIACQRNNRLFMCCDNNPEYIKISNQLLTQKTVSGFNPLNEESLISVKRESTDSPNSPQTDNTNKEEANFS